MDKGILIATIAVIVAIAAFAAFVMYLDECVKTLYKERNKVKREIAETEARLDTLRKLGDAACCELDQTREENSAALDELDETKAEIEGLGAALVQVEEAILTAKQDLERERRDAMSYGAYSVAACALLNDLDMAMTTFPVREVPYLASGIDTLALRHPAGYEMKRKGMLTIGDVVKSDPEFLMSIRGVGPGTIDTIIKKLEDNGCSFGMEYIRINDRYFVKE